MEEMQRRRLTDEELTVELAKDPKEIDYDGLLKRGAKQDYFRRVYYAVEYAIRHMPGGEEKFQEAVREYYATHNPDIGDGLWWIACRSNELMGSPLKFAPLPEWERPKKTK